MMIFGRKLEFNEAFNEGIKSLINLRNEYTSLLRYPLNQIFLSFFKEYELYDDYERELIHAISFYHDFFMFKPHIAFNKSCRKLNTKFKSIPRVFDTLPIPIPLTLKYINRNDLDDGFFFKVIYKLLSKLSLTPCDLRTHFDSNNLRFIANLGDKFLVEDYFKGLINNYFSPRTAGYIIDLNHGDEYRLNHMYYNFYLHKYLNNEKKLQEKHHYISNNFKLLVNKDNLHILNLIAISLNLFAPKGQRFNKIDFYLALNFWNECQDFLEETKIIPNNNRHQREINAKLLLKFYEDQVSINPEAYLIKNLLDISFYSIDTVKGMENSFYRLMKAR